MRGQWLARRVGQRPAGLQLIGTNRRSRGWSFTRHRLGRGQRLLASKPPGGYLTAQDLGVGKGDGQARKNAPRLANVGQMTHRDRTLLDCAATARTYPVATLSCRVASVLHGRRCGCGPRERAPGPSRAARLRGYGPATP
jgi:hypothetical protein